MLCYFGNLYGNRDGGGQGKIDPGKKKKIGMVYLSVFMNTYGSNFEGERI